MYQSVVFGRSIKAMLAENDPDQRDAMLEGLRSEAAKFYKDYDQEVEERVMAAMMEYTYGHIDLKYAPDCLKNADRKFKGDFNMKVIYVKTSDEIRRERANARNGDTTTWDRRSADEDGQFNCFEARKPWDAVVTNDGELVEAENEFVFAVSKLLSGGEDVEN